MSDYKFPQAEVVKYHARQIMTFCKEHRCATCPFHTDMGCSFLRNSPYEWKGLEECKNDRPKGHWIRRPQGHYVCSLCEKGMYKSDFCPSCGADMRGDNNENND